MATYNDLLDAGWKMKEIDETDILGFWKVRIWTLKSADKGEIKTPDGKIFIDDVWK